MNKLVWFRTKQSLTNLIENCLFVQEEAKKNKLIEGCNQLSILKDYCTVSLNSGRRTGKTTAMVELGAVLFKNPLFCFYNEGLAKCFFESFGKNMSLDRSSFLSCSSNSFLSCIRGRRYDAIFVDGVSYMNEDTISIINEVAAQQLKFNDDGFVLAFIG